MDAFIGTLRIILEYTDVPSLVLLIMVAAALAAMYSAQRRTDWDWGEMFRDENGKLSAFRLVVAPTWALSAWWVIYLTMNIRVDLKTSWVEALNALFPWYVAFLVVWSGAKIVEKVVDIAIAKFFPQFGPVVQTPAPATATASVGGVTATATAAQPDKPT
jgi:hypothetical protein